MYLNIKCRILLKLLCIFLFILILVDARFRKEQQNEQKAPSVPEGHRRPRGREQALEGKSQALTVINSVVDKDLVGGAHRRPRGKQTSHISQTKMNETQTYDIPKYSQPMPHDSFLEPHTNHDIVDEKNELSLDSFREKHLAESGVVVEEEEVHSWRHNRHRHSHHVIRHVYQAHEPVGYDEFSHDENGNLIKVSKKHPHHPHLHGM